MKTCEYCGKELERKHRESANRFAGRRFCNSACANAIVGAANLDKARQTWATAAKRRMAVVLDLVESGRSDVEIAAEVGLKPASLAGWLVAHGRRDLAPQFYRAEKYLRKATGQELQNRHFQDDDECRRPSVYEYIRLDPIGDWVDKGLCVGIGDPDRFFPHKTDEVTIQAAKKICRNCRVRHDCLQWALDNNEPGVWGGTTTKERQDMRRQRGAA